MLQNYFQHIGVSILILVGTIIIGVLFSRYYRKFILRSTRLIKNDPTNYKFTGHAITAMIYILGFSVAIYQIPQLRSMANSLLAGAGILAVAIGFASNHALSNIISGMFIVIFKPFRVNDRLQLRDKMEGVVEDITLRHTVIRDFENKRIIIPNTVISDEIIVNSDFADEPICRGINLTISFDSDMDKAKAIIYQVIKEHPLFIDNRKNEEKEADKPMVPVRVIDLNHQGVTLRAWTWAENAGNSFLLQCDVLESIKKRFDESGIEFANPLRSIFKS